MQAIQYPFIDIAVHAAVRARFARGEALALFSLDLANVLWANGAGAAFFGTSSIYDLLEDGPPKQDVTFRQISAMARQLQQTGDARKLVVRVGSGFRLVPMEAHLERLEIRKGEPVILFSMPVSHANDATRFQAMLRGFDDPDTHMALLDNKGQIIRGSSNFDRLGITPRTAHTIVTMAETHAGGLMKRPIPTARGYLPAAVGKIADEPAVFLLFAVETLLGSLDVSDGFAPEAATAEVPPQREIAPEQVVIETPLPQEEEEHTTAEMEFAEVVSALGDIDELECEPEDISADTVEPVAAQDDVIAEDAIAEQVSSDVTQAEEVLPAEMPEQTSLDAPDNVAEAVPEPSFESVEEPTAADNDIAADEVAEVEPPIEAAIETDETDNTGNFVFRPTSRAVRFVWKIDALGCFSDISPEFATAVGPGAASIEGQTFNDLAALFNLDPDGQISALLTKRDTWSGKTIYWPIEGTSLKVPVDLAALPTYTRNRDFDGFRGFGVVRLADAVEDPDKVGLTFLKETTAPEETDAEANVDADVEPNNAEDAVSAPVAEVALASDEAVVSKIIQLESRRPSNNDRLTPGEHAAFREIARKLDALGVKPAEVPAETPVTAQNNNSPNDNQPSDIVADAQAPADITPETKPAESPAQTAPPSPLPLPAMPEMMLPVSKRDVTFSPDVLDMLPIALLAHRGDQMIHANSEFLALTGYKDLEALEAAGGLDALLQEADLSPEDEAAGKLVAVRADGQHLPVSARLQSIRWEEASALLLALVPQAITPHTQQTPALEPEPTLAETQPAAAEFSAPASDALARLRVEVEELRSILETATDGVVTISAEGDIRSVNGAASALFNYDESDIRGKPFVTLFAHESQRAILDYLNGLTGHGVASVLNDGREVIGREASGGFIPLFMAIGRLSSSNGFCAVIRDITQWKRTEEELRNAKRVAETANAHKSDFLARVSHEIRTPLNAIIGFADIMADERFGPIGHPRYAEYSSDIGRSGRHVLDIVNDLLDISKIEAGEMDMDFISVGLNETVSEAVALVQPQANAQRVIIRTALSQSVPNVVADLRSIKQIVLNILSNAIRFTPSGGQIIVSTAYESNGSVTLRVRDTGIGMSRAELDQAMKPFRQVSPGGARLRGDGTGLGLPLTKAMADANRANFAIHSTPNEGTLVEISFPSPRVLAG